MQRRIGVFGTTEETLRLLRTLLASPQVEVVALFDPDLGQARARVQRIVPQLAHLIDPLLTDDIDDFVRTPELQAVIDGTQPPCFERRFAQTREHIQVLSPLGARMLWGYESATAPQRDELLATLSELVGSLDWAIDDGTLCDRDLSQLLTGPVFIKIRQSQARFDEVRVEGGTLAWPNGADLCPDVIIWGGMPPDESKSNAPV